MERPGSIPPAATAPADRAHALSRVHDARGRAAAAAPGAADRHDAHEARRVARVLRRELEQIHRGIRRAEARLEDLRGAPTDRAADAFCPSETARTSLRRYAPDPIGVVRPRPVEAPLVPGPAPVHDFGRVTNLGTLIDVLA